MSFQRYEVLELLDSGGMAEVFRASATTADGEQRTVAIKRVLPSVSRNRKFMAMFVDEARLAMHLDHPNIIQVFELGMTDGTYFLVMEYLDGINLQQLMDAREGQQPPLDQSLCAHVVAAVCDGLAHAHEKRDLQGRPLGIVHRDVSPPNILISRQGKVKLADFGLAKAHSQVERTDPGVVKGKFAYLSPEAARGESVDHRADLFCLGVVLWELLAGRRLFRGSSDVASLQNVRRCEIPSISTLRPDIHPELAALLGRALAENPAERWASARSMGGALSAYLQACGVGPRHADVAALACSLDPEGAVVPKPAPPGEQMLVVERAVQLELERLQPLASEAEVSTREPGSLPLTLDESGTIVPGEARHLDGSPRVQPAPKAAQTHLLSETQPAPQLLQGVPLGWVVLLLVVAMGLASSLTIFLLGSPAH